MKCTAADNRATISTEERGTAQQSAAHFNKENIMDYSSREGVLIPDGVRRKLNLCSAASAPTNIPLRIKKELAVHALADSEFKQISTEDLVELARSRKRVYVTDRASAIAALKGVFNPYGKVKFGSTRQ